MKAPRTTVKRPIFRHIIEIEKEENENAKESKDVKIIDNEKNEQILESFTTPPIEFDVQGPINPIISNDNLINDNISSLVDSYNDIFDITDNCFDFLFSVDFDSFI